MLNVNKENIVQGLQDHVQEVFDKLLDLNPKFVFDDVLFDSRVVQPTYIGLCASVGGIQVVIPQANKMYGDTLYRLRDELLEQQGDEVIRKEGGKQRVLEIVKETFEPNKIKNGVKRWVVNKILNLLFGVMCFLMILDLTLFPSQAANTPFFGFVFILFSAGIMYYEYKNEMKMPFSNKGQTLNKLHCILLSCLVFSYGLISLEMNTLAGIIIGISSIMIMFLKNDGEKVIGYAPFIPKSEIFKVLIFAIVGAILGLTISFGSGFLSMLAWTYICSSLVFGFAVSGNSRVSKTIEGARWANEEDAAMDKYNDSLNSLPTLGGGIAARQNMDARTSRIVIFVLDVVMAVPIGAIVLPYYTFLMFKPPLNVQAL